MILGNQKWKGTEPIFINIAEFIIIDNKSLINIFIRNKFNRIENKKLIDAIDWVKKYFNEASEFNRLLGEEIKGINLSKLISKPIQHPNHEFDEIEIIVLKNKINKKNILLELLINKIKNKNKIKYSKNELKFIIKNYILV